MAMFIFRVKFEDENEGISRVCKWVFFGQNEKEVRG
jgi:hypothetical protein